MQVVSSLSPVEGSLLNAKLVALEACLEPGLTRLNWNSRGIDSFVATTTKAIKEFQALHHSVKKNSAIVEKLVNALAAAQLVADIPAGQGHFGTHAACSHSCCQQPAVHCWAGRVLFGVLHVPAQVTRSADTTPQHLMLNFLHWLCNSAIGMCVCLADKDVMELQEFYEYMEQRRANAVDAAVQRYRSLTPVLGKVGPGSDYDQGCWWPAWHRFQTRPNQTQACHLSSHPAGVRGLCCLFCICCVAG